MRVRIEGKRVVLRDWRESDFAPWAHWLDGERRWMELDAPYYAKPGRAQVERMVSHRRQRLRTGDWSEPRRELVVADPSDEFLGMVTWAWESEPSRWPSAGIVLFDPDRWGRGRGGEALGLWIDYLFAGLDVARLDLRTWSGNPAMMRLAQKLGFELEARFREAREVEGARYDGLVYGILRREWHAAYPEGYALAAD